MSLKIINASYYNNSTSRENLGFIDEFDSRQHGIIEMFGGTLATLIIQDTNKQDSQIHNINIQATPILAINDFKNNQTDLLNPSTTDMILAGIYKNMLQLTKQSGRKMLYVDKLESEYVDGIITNFTNNNAAKANYLMKEVGKIVKIK